MVEMFKRQRPRWGGDPPPARNTRPTVTTPATTFRKFFS